jgi:hypothetical protein
MSRIFLFLGVAFCLLGIPCQSRAQCPQSPNANVRYSQRFYQAQKTFIERSHSAASEINVELPEMDVPIGASHVSRDELKTLQSVTLDQAYDYIQDELRNERTAIVAECSAALCQATAGGNQLQVNSALKIQAIASICRDALNMGAGGWTESQVIALPSPLMVVFRPQEKQRTVRVHLANLTGGTMRMRINEPDDLTRDERATMPALFAGNRGRKRFQLQPHGKISLPFIVRKPDLDDGPQFFSAEFLTEPNNSVATTVVFYLVPSRNETLPPPEMSCGVANPRAHIKAESDDGRTHEEDHSTPTILTHGANVKGGPVWDWIHNGGGAGKSEYQMRCPQLTRGRDSGTVRFEFTGTAGGKCARNGSNKGGQGHNNPNWRTQVGLFGFSDTKWTVRVAARARRAVHRGACRLLFGVDQSTVVPLDNSIVTVEKKDLPPGQYSIELDCTGEDVGCYGGQEYTWVTGSDNIIVDVEAKRQ